MLLRTGVRRDRSSSCSGDPATSRGRAHPGHSGRGPVWPRARRYEPQLLRRARPHPARHRGDLRVHRPLPGGGRRVARAERPAVGGPGRGRHRAALPGVQGRSDVTGTLPWRSWLERFWAASSCLRLALGQPFSGRQGLSIADGGRRRWSCCPAGSLAGGSNLGDPGFFARVSPWPYSARRSPTRWSWRRCTSSRRGRSGCWWAWSARGRGARGPHRFSVKDLSANEVVAIGLVVAASAGALSAAATPSPVEAWRRGARGVRSCEFLLGNRMPIHLT